MSTLPLELLTPLNPMVFYERFPHIPEKVFEIMDIESLKKFRKVSKSWQECIDNRDILWNKVSRTKNDAKALQSACEKGHSKMVKVLIQKSAEFNIDLNAKDKFGTTIFHQACMDGWSKIAEILIQNSAEFNINLNAGVQLFIVLVLMINQR